MGETELGEYLGQQGEDQEDIKRQFRTGSVLSFYNRLDDKHTIDMTVGVKSRDIGVSFVLSHPGVSGGGSVALGILDGTGSAADGYAGSYGYMGEHNLGAWTFESSGTA